jgi:dihydrofolate reductase
LAGVAAVAETQGCRFDLLLGRRTYYARPDFWPKAGNNPMANCLNAVTKYVATYSPEGVAWGSVADLGVNILAGIHGLWAMNGPDLIVCLTSSTLTSVLLEQGLVNEALLLIYPILLGWGKHFFGSSRPARVRVCQHAGE